QLTDIRDMWSNHFCRPEQARLILTAGEARITNRIPGLPRRVFFVGGDLHSGGVFRIQVDKPRLSFTTQCLVTSEISKQTGTGIEGAVGVVVDEDFEVVDGIHATLQYYTPIYNFGVTHILFGAGEPTINHAVAREGDDRYLSIKLFGLW